MSSTRPYGSWPSAVRAEHVAAAGRKFADLKADPAPAGDAMLYWVESCPDEAGRNTIMRADGAGTTESLLAAPWSARSAVYEYGGGAFTVHAGVVWFVNATDQAIWRRDADASLHRVCGDGAEARFADLQYDAEPRATLVTVAADGRRTLVAAGHDFYASPRLSPAGDRLVWLAWNHPDMPWDRTELWEAAIAADGAIGTPVRRWAPDDASLFGPTFAPDGRLHVVCDADNWWNVYRERDDGFEQLTRQAAEFGVPQWVFGQSTLAFADDGRLYALATRDGLWRIGCVDTHSGAFEALATPADFFEQLQPFAHGVAVIAADAATPKHILAVDAAQQPRVLRRGDGLPEDASLAVPEAITWPSGDGRAHGLFYAPTNRDYVGPVDARPPLILKCHGGPTGATSTALDARIQYWTSRGYAVLDVNYRGSTGYGRAYRQQLDGAWGVADVEDCASGARHLADRGLVDRERVLISGSSAGGYTVLCVLTFTDVAAAGASYYGIGDLRRLLASTHKFESRYLYRLIGDDARLLDARSPLVHAERLSCPVLFLQGLKDKVVPPDQAETMVAALRERGVPVAYVTFAEEGHGFRDARHIVRAIESERAFYTRVLGIDADVGDVDIDIQNF